MRKGGYRPFAKKRRDHKKVEHAFRFRRNAECSRPRTTRRSNRHPCALRENERNGAGAQACPARQCQCTRKYPASPAPAAFDPVHHSLDANPLFAQIHARRGCSSMAEQKLPKLTTRVRFPSPAPVSPHLDHLPVPFARRDLHLIWAQTGHLTMSDSKRGSHLAAAGGVASLPRNRGG